VSYADVPWWATTAVEIISRTANTPVSFKSRLVMVNPRHPSKFIPAAPRGFVTPATPRNFRDSCGPSLAKAYITVLPGMSKRSSAFCFPGPVGGIPRQTLPRMSDCPCARSPVHTGDRDGRAESRTDSVVKNFTGFLHGVYYITTLN